MEKKAGLVEDLAKFQGVLASIKEHKGTNRDAPPIPPTHHPRRAQQRPRVELGGRETPEGHPPVRHGWLRLWEGPFAP